MNSIIYGVALSICLYRSFDPGFVNIFGTISPSLNTIGIEAPLSTSGTAFNYFPGGINTVELVLS